MNSLCFHCGKYEADTYAGAEWVSGPMQVIQVLMAAPRILGYMCTGRAMLPRCVWAQFGACGEGASESPCPAPFMQLERALWESMFASLGNLNACNFPNGANVGFSDCLGRGKILRGEGA